MKKFLDLIADEMKAAFAGCGYEESYAKVVLSNRRISVNISAMALWQLQKPIKRNRLILLQM